MKLNDELTQAIVAHREVRSDVVREATMQAILHLRITCKELLYAERRAHRGEDRGAHGLPVYRPERRSYADAYPMEATVECMDINTDLLRENMEEPYVAEVTVKRFSVYTLELDEFDDGIRWHEIRRIPTDQQSLSTRHKQVCRPDEPFSTVASTPLDDLLDGVDWNERDDVRAQAVFCGLADRKEAQQGKYGGSLLERGGRAIAQVQASGDVHVEELGSNEAVISEEVEPTQLGLTSRTLVKRSTHNKPLGMIAGDFGRELMAAFRVAADQHWWREFDLNREVDVPDDAPDDPEDDENLSALVRAERVIKAHFALEYRMLEMTAPVDERWEDPALLLRAVVVPPDPRDPVGGWHPEVLLTPNPRAEYDMEAVLERFIVRTREAKYGWDVPMKTQLIALQRSLTDSPMWEKPAEVLPGYRAVTALDHYGRRVTVWRHS